MKSLSSITVLLLFQNINIHSIFGIYYCDDYGCDNQYFYETEDVYCRGYRACYNSYVKADGTNIDVYCTGDEGCRESNITSDNSNIHVYGYQSAYLATLDANYDIECYGYKSCYQSQIVNTGNSYHLLCNGYYSCQEADIRNTDDIIAYGASALYYATFDSQGETTINIDLFGYRAGDGFIIYCRDGSTCNIDCGSNEGCYNTDLYCYSGSICKYNCDNNLDYCPQLFDSSILMKKYNGRFTMKQIDQALYEKELENQKRKELIMTQLKNKNKNENININTNTNKLLLYDSNKIFKNIQDIYDNDNFYIIIIILTFIITIIIAFLSIYLCCKNPKLNNKYQLLF